MGVSGSHLLFVAEPDRRLPWWQRGLVAVVAGVGWVPMFAISSRLRCASIHDTMPMACLLGALATGALYCLFAVRRRPAWRAILMGAGIFGMTFLALEWIVPGSMGRVDRGKQKRTMRDIRALATGLEALGTNAGYPNVADARDLADRMGWGSKGPLLDGWGFPIEVHVRPDRYVIRSAGPCGAFETSDPWAYEGPAGTTDDRADIVFSDGRFIRFPDGTQR